jgi:ATP phosphoribosyltransferase
MIKGAGCFKMKLRLGIPDGSMIDPKRGGLKELLDRSGIFIDYLGKGRPLEVKNVPWLEAREARPQELPALTNYGYCDVFFGGDDWAKEWEYRGIKTEKLIGLGIGKVDIVDARKNKDDCLIWASEYPYLAKNYLGETAEIVNIGDDIPSRDILSEQDKKIVLYSWGKTEPKAFYGLADGIIECTQSGKTIENYKLSIVCKVMSSECSLYVGPNLDERQKDKVMDLKSMLEKVLVA